MLNIDRVKSQRFNMKNQCRKDREGMRSMSVTEMIKKGECAANHCKKKKEKNLLNSAGPEQ